MILPATTHEPDYLVIGHITLDVLPAGNRLGGTAAYAGLTAHALGRRVAVVTAAGPELDLQPIGPLTVARIPSQISTTFENRYDRDKRKQLLHAVATPLSLQAVEAHMPAAWRRSQIVHLAPVADEVDPALASRFSGALLGLTPQGWFRRRSPLGKVRPSFTDHGLNACRLASAVVVSLEDVGGDERLVAALIDACPVVAVTLGRDGCRLYWNGDVRRLAAPTLAAVDGTGAGDVFAAAFFVRLHHTRDPWEAARFATQLASASVTRTGLAGVPTPAEVRAAEITIT